MASPASGRVRMALARARRRVADVSAPPAMKAMNTAPPAPMTRASVSAQRATAAGSAVGAAPPAMRPVAAPIAKPSVPPTGWPSAEATRQLSAWLPRVRLLEGVTVSTPFAEAIAADGTSVTSPSGPIQRRASGPTGSLKVSTRRDGACGRTLPSTGSLDTSAAWASAPPGASDSSRARTASKTRIGFGPRRRRGSSFHSVNGQRPVRRRP